MEQTKKDIVLYTKTKCPECGADMKMNLPDNAECIKCHKVYWHLVGDGVILELQAIRGFFDEHRFLSNFWSCNIDYEGLRYSSSEAAYQAAKCFDLRDRHAFVGIVPALAKKMGKHVKIKSQWDDLKLGIMEDIVRLKFTQNPGLAVRLRHTYGWYLEETNTWGDRFWGVYNGAGNNHLGRILMKIREELTDF